MSTNKKMALTPQIGKRVLVEDEQLDESESGASGSGSDGVSPNVEDDSTSFNLVMPDDGDELLELSVNEQEITSERMDETTNHSSCSDDSSITSSDKTWTLSPKTNADEKCDGVSDLALSLKNSPEPDGQEEPESILPTKSSTAATPSPAKRRRGSASPDANTDSKRTAFGLAEGYYVVEHILDKCVHAGKTTYLTKWLGYSKNENTWEPKDNLPPQMVVAFEEEFAKKKKGPSKKQGKRKQEKQKSVPRKIRWTAKNTSKGRAKAPVAQLRGSMAGPSRASQQDKEARRTKKDDRFLNIEDIDPNRKIHKIHGMGRNRDGRFFVVQFQGRTSLSNVMSVTMHRAYPQDIIRYYESKIFWINNEICNIPIKISVDLDEEDINDDETINEDEEKVNEDEEKVNADEEDIENGENKEEKEKINDDEEDIENEVNIEDDLKISEDEESS